MSLTGRFNFRRTWTGKIVLQVEEERRSLLSKALRKHWRDAGVLDLAAPALRRLIDMRLRPAYAVEPATAAAAAPAPEPAEAGAGTIPFEPAPALAPTSKPDGQSNGRIVTH